MAHPTPADAAKMLPCPFCGSSNVRATSLYPCSLVKCYVCKSRTVQPTIAEAIAAWNTRPQPAPPEGEPDFNFNFDFIVEHLYRHGDRKMIRDELNNAYRLGQAAHPKVGGDDLSVLASDYEQTIERLAGELERAQFAVDWLALRVMEDDNEPPEVKEACDAYAARQQQKGADKTEGT